MNNKTQLVPEGVVRIGAPVVWDRSRGQGVKIAIIDSGADLEHPDLKPNLKNGMNFVNTALPPQDDHGHGTHVCGITAACDNGAGIIGVAPEAEIYPLKVLDRRGRGELGNIAAAFEWAIDNHMHIINMSIGIQQHNETLENLVETAVRAGIAVISAAGNDGRPFSVDFPAALPGALAVGAIGGRNRLCWFSSRGPEIDLVAPGELVLSTAKGGGYSRMSGTSMAASHVSGALALLISATGWPAKKAVKALISSAERLPHLKTEQQGYGLVRIDTCFENLLSERW